jgi:hypothetical protein
MRGASAAGSAGAGRGLIFRRGDANSCNAAQTARRSGSGKRPVASPEITKRSQFIIGYQSFNFRESQSSRPWRM